MSASNDDLLDELLAHRIVEPCGNGIMVTIPGFEDLSEAQQETIRLKLLKLEEQPALDINALHSALTALSDRSDSPETPPPDPPEVQLQVNIEREAQARRTLEEDGCVPCYPVSFSCPLPEDVGAYHGVISYFKKYGDEDRVLCAQLSDWEHFRNFQSTNRRHFLSRSTFTAFQDKVHARRRRHKLEGVVSLKPDPKEQRPLDDWMEYQDYHLMIREELEQKVEKDNETLISTQREADGMQDPPSKMLNEIRVYSYRIDRDSTKRKRQEPLLEWIEQQRLILVANGDRHRHGFNENDFQCETPESIPEISIPRDRTKKHKATSAQSSSPPKAAKGDVQARNLRPRKRDLEPEAQMVNTQRRGSAVSLRSKPRRYKSERQRKMPEPPKPVPQRDPKAAKRPSDKSLNGPRLSQTSASVITRTRAGRISKKPERIGFG